MASIEAFLKVKNASFSNTCKGRQGVGSKLLVRSNQPFLRFPSSALEVPLLLLKHSLNKTLMNIHRRNKSCTGRGTDFMS